MPATIEKSEIFKRQLWDDDGDLYVQAVVTIKIPYENVFIYQTIESPGLYGIDEKSSAEYLDEAYDIEREILVHMLAALGIETT